MRYLLAVYLLLVLTHSSWGAELSPIGAERAGNDTGSIPAWQGGLTTPPEGYEPGGWLVDPFADEEPLLTITPSNAAQHATHLTPGQRALFDAYPESFRIHVYPTHRVEARPAFVYDALQDNAQSAELAANGLFVKGAEIASPFLQPDSGLEVLWNWLAHWRPHSDTLFATGEPTPSGKIRWGVQNRRFFAAYAYGKENELWRAVEIIRAPTEKNGYLYLLLEPDNFDKRKRSAWQYEPYNPQFFPQGNSLRIRQRKVRMIPPPRTDRPVGSGAAWVDSLYGFNGTPEHFDWKLLGKREIYVPYNNYSLINNTLHNGEIVQAHHFNSDLLRYELHRVWVVEATRKADGDHISPKRVLYFDEDSWIPLLSEAYDEEGNIWKVYQNFEPFDYSCLCNVGTLQTIHDLKTKRYYFQGLLNGERPRIYMDDVTPAEFTPAHLRRIGTR